VGARKANPSGKLNAGKSYVVFGKNNNTNVIELSDIAAGIAKPVAITSSPLFPNTLRTLVLLEACNKSSKLSFRVLLPESKYAIDYLGNKHTNTLTGTTKDEIFVAGVDNNVIVAYACIEYVHTTVAY
jgi:hypothetical protein